MSKYWADFDASISIEAENKEEAETKFWEIISLIKSKYNIESVGLDDIEEIKETE